MPEGVPATPVVQDLPKALDLTCDLTWLTCLIVSEGTCFVVWQFSDECGQISLFDIGLVPMQCPHVKKST